MALEGLASERRGEPSRGQRDADREGAPSARTPDRLPDADRQPRRPEPARPPGARGRRPRRLRGHAAHRPALERLDIRRPRFVSYHEQNEAERARQLVAEIERGARVALVSDAGTPAISDPGYRLIRALHRAGARGRGAPGPVGGDHGAGRLGPARRPLALRGLPAAPRAASSSACCSSPETVVAFESPRRLPTSLSALAALAPDRQAAVCRELTKLHEEVARGTLGELARRFRDESKGEIVRRDRADLRAARSEPRRGLRGRRAAPPGAIRRPPARGRERGRRAHRDARERPLSRPHRPRSARIAPDEMVTKRGLTAFPRFRGAGLSE